MDRYQRVEKPRPEESISENEIRITAMGLIRNYISYATTLLQEKRDEEIVLKAMGQAISKTVAIAEIIKKRIPGLYQDTSISSRTITDAYEPIEEGLEPLEMTRQVSLISITLSTNELNKNSPGYQAPSNTEQSRSESQQQPLPPRQAVVSAENNLEFYGGRGRGRGRRKLEALAQQLVVMGFSQERATMALILKEGRVEESVAWLFEEGEEADKHMEYNLDSGSNLKIDISEELARVADMEIRYKCSKQEVERAIVACEGDLDKAEESLRIQKQDPLPAPPKPEETGDPPTLGNSKLPIAASQNSLRVQPNKPSPATMIQQKRDEKDFNYTKVAVTAGSLVDPGNKNLQSLKRIQPKMDWAKPQQIGVPAEKQWPIAGSNPSVSYSLASSLQASPPPAKTEACYVGSELKNLQIGSVREPVIVMQRPQSINGKQTPSTSVSSSSPGTTVGWYANSVETLKPNGFVLPVSGVRSLNANSASMNQLYNQFQYQPQQQFVSSSGVMDVPVTSRGNGLWSKTGASPTLAPASNLGLFCGLGTNGSSGASSPVDWNTGGSMMQQDYTNIDWSLDRGSSMSRPIGLWPGMNSFMQNETPRKYDSFSSGMGVKSAMRPVLSNGNSVPIAGLQDGVGSTETSTSGSREWTSPFEEKDLFSLPRQFVSSPSL